MTSQRVARILRLVAESFQTTPELILSKTRQHPAFPARCATFWICRHLEEPAPSYPHIARLLQRDDHTQVMYGCDWIDRKMRNSPWYAHTMRSMLDQLRMPVQPDPHLLLVDTLVPPSQFDMSEALEVSIIQG